MVKAIYCIFELSYLFNFLVPDLKGPLYKFLIESVLFVSTTVAVFFIFEIIRAIRYQVRVKPNETISSCK
jgi:hypothetical protein